MAIDGGGSGGGPIGVGNTTAVSSGFQTIGNRIYAYTGEVAGSDSAVATIFSGRIPQGARYHLKIYQDIDTSGSYTSYLFINEEEIAKYFISGDESLQSNNALEIYVGPDTLVEVKAFDTSSGADHLVRIIGEQF